MLDVVPLALVVPERNRPNIWRLKLALARFGGCHSIAGTPDQTAGLAPDDNELALISSPDPPARAIQMHRQWDLIKTPATAARVNFGSRPIEPATSVGPRGTVRQLGNRQVPFPSKWEHSPVRQVDAPQTRRSCVMKKMVISFALGAGAVFASSAADAAPLTKALTILPNDNIENVRLVCDRRGHCYHTGGARRGIVQPGYANGYGYGPGYYNGPGYYGGGYGPGYYGGYGPGVGIGVGPFGVGVGFGPRWESGSRGSLASALVASQRSILAAAASRDSAERRYWISLTLSGQAKLLGTSPDVR